MKSYNIHDTDIVEWKEVHGVKAVRFDGTYVEAELLCGTIFEYDSRESFKDEKTKSKITCLDCTKKLCESLGIVDESLGM